MCGITGIYNFKTKNRIERRIVEEMTESLSHRGPDGQGIYINQRNHLGLGHRRLSIIDAPKGDQPMSDDEGNIHISFNGEIYNFLELKEGLNKKNYRFKTNSDTEVIIYLYKEYGVSCFRRLNGMFALALFDETKQTLVLARDHFGVKPLYWSETQSGIVFASEIKAILKYPEYKKELDFRALDSFLALRYNPSPQTLFKKIFKLPPATLLIISPAKQIEEKKIFSFHPETDHKINQNEAIEKYQLLIERAVKRQFLTSGVPVGLFLSGGVDSAMIGYLMQKYSFDKIKAFTIGFQDRADLNEISLAHKTANFLGCGHRHLTIGKGQYLSALPESIAMTEEPIAEPTIPALYLLAKFTSQFTKVVLSGQGADELFGGYQRYIGANLIFRNIHLVKFLSKFGFSRTERYARTRYASQFNDTLQRIVGIYSIFTPEQKRNLYKEKRLESESILPIFQDHFKESLHLDSDLARLLFLDLRFMLPDDLLLFNDKTTMAHSLENRVPFLDIDLVSFIESLPIEKKIGLFNQKIIHKKGAGKWLPNEIINRKKNFFATPMNDWLRQDLIRKFIKIIKSKGSACNKFFNLDYIEKMGYSYASGKADYSRHLIILIYFEIWYQYYFENSVVDLIK